MITCKRRHPRCKWPSSIMIGLIFAAVIGGFARDMAGDDVSFEKRGLLGRDPETAIAQTRISSSEAHPRKKRKKRKKTPKGATVVSTAKGFTLAWNPSASSPNIDGYRVYYGTASGSYSQHVDVGLATTAAVPTVSGSTYYYVVVVYKGFLESSPSNEVTSAMANQIPTPIAASTPTPRPTPLVRGTPAPPPIIVAAPTPPLKLERNGSEYNRLTPARISTNTSVTAEFSAPMPTPASVPDSAQEATLTAATAPTPTLRFQKRLRRLHMPQRKNSTPNSSPSANSQDAPQSATTAREINGSEVNSRQP